MAINFLPKQTECLNALAIDSAAEVVLFGGAAGGAKSFTGCAWQIMRRLKYPGTRGLIGRSKLDTLKKTTLKTFFEVAGMFGLRAHEHYTYNAQSNVITFYNGSEIILKDLFAYPSDPSFDSLGSLEITDGFLDECSQISKKAVDIVRSRIRYRLTQNNLTPKILLTCNPSKGWLYNEFFAPFRSGQLPPHLVFIQSRVTDNPHLPATYAETLARLPEVDRKRLLDGDWDYDETLDALFSTDDLLRCFRTPETTGELYITADIARLGKDRTVIALWRGLSLIQITELRKKRIDETAAVIRELADYHKVKLSNVIADADQIVVKFQDDHELPAKVLGRDPKTDLAVLKVESPTPLPFLKLGDSTKIRVGDWVIAIGNPFGLGGSVSAGIISARQRDIRSGPYDDYLQTDAAINKGNSGGPMLNMDGEVIGVNSAIFSPTGGSVGIGFAVPTSLAHPIIDQLRRFGETRRGWLGVHIQTVTDEIAKTLGLDRARGALVASVAKDGPAMAGGIKEQDVILKFNGRDIDKVRRLPRIVAETEIGSEVEVVVWRDGIEKMLKIKVARLDESSAKMATGAEDPTLVLPSLGLVLLPLTDEARS
ncbi:MAG: PDZ domain-containing protein, partial [Flavobacteriaceae bacterium]|nr:PDZ domain-containing protein [Flavobacteriaceae bacterium]